MQPDISALSRYQIGRFFQENAPITQQQCDAMAQQLTGQSVTPTLSQGGTSYTVEAGEVVVQFRVPNSALDMELLQSIEHAYRGFTPHHQYQGRLDKLHVYTMNNIGGTCMYLARNELQSNNYHLLQSTINDYARLDIIYNCNLSKLLRPTLPPFKAGKSLANVTDVDSSPQRILTRPTGWHAQIPPSYLRNTRHNSSSCARDFLNAFTQCLIMSSPNSLSFLPRTGHLCLTTPTS